MQSLEQLRKNILTLVEEYGEVESKMKKPFKPGDKIHYSGRVYGPEERVKLVDSSLDFWLTSGRYCHAFEKGLSSYLGIKHVALVNSGSSANLLAFMTLTSPVLGERAIQRGDEVICVAAAFPTTVSPVIQFGAVPVFLDIELGTYNIDVSQLENALTPKTKCVFIAHSLGNPFNLKEVKTFCDKHNLWLIEDNCDALGAEYNTGSGYRKTGTFGDIGTSSFYPAHHITMGEGGAVYTNNDTLGRIMLSIRDWGRDCVCPTGRDNTCGHRFNGQFGELPRGYDHKFVYSHFGYNLKVTEMQAAIGCAQLVRLPDFVKKRQENWKVLKTGLNDLEDRLILPCYDDNAIPSWFGFVITLRKGFNRSQVINFIEQRGVQTRMLFSGNLLRHPCFDAIRNDKSRYKVIGNLLNTDTVVTNTFWVGVYPGLDSNMLDFMLSTIRESVIGQ